jgi:hypothetical protein
VYLGDDEFVMLTSVRGVSWHILVLIDSKCFVNPE